MTTALNRLTLNLDLLTRLVAWAMDEADELEQWLESLWGPRPEGSWAQETWAKEWRNGVCRSAFCIAGQGAVQSGWMFPMQGKKLAQDAEEHYSQVYPRVRIGMTKDDRPIYAPDLDRGSEVAVVAMEALGITYGERITLFHGDNTVWDVWCAASIIAESRGLRLDLREPGANDSRMLHVEEVSPRQALQDEMEIYDR